MRRPKLVSYLFSSAAVAAFSVLSACNDAPDQLPPPKPDQAIYATYEQCLVDNTPAECKAALDMAKAEQKKDAPVLNTLAQCEQQYPGHCEPHDGGGFSPMMTGFMLGQMMNGGSYGPRYYPVYYGSSGAVYTGRGTVVTQLPPAQLATVTRGGFAGRTAEPIHVTPSASSGIPMRSPSSYASFRSGSGYYGSSGGYARSSGVTSRGGFGSSVSAHGGFGGGE